MAYSERFYDDERQQVYAELVFHSMGQYPNSENAAFAELLSHRQIEALRPHKAGAGSWWQSIFRLPFLGAPSLT